VKEEYSNDLSTGANQHAFIRTFSQVEIGDSRWALLTFDAKTNKYKCSYLAEAHMHIDRDTLAPFQVAAPKADFGKSPDYYFNERDHQKKVLRYGICLFGTRVSFVHLF